MTTDEKSINEDIELLVNDFISDENNEDFLSNLNDILYSVRYLERAKAREETLKDVDNVLEEIDDIAYDGIHQTINEYDALEGIRDKIKDLKKSLSQKEGEKA
jgi:hypothetical protein